MFKNEAGEVTLFGAFVIWCAVMGVSMFFAGNEITVEKKTQKTHVESTLE